MTREEAIDVLQHNYPSACFTDLCEAVEIAIQALSAQPEHRKGVWLDDDGEILTDGYCATCSVCGEWSEYLTAYCGNCGAKMEGSK